MLLANAITTWIEHFSGPWLYVIVFVLTFAETGTLLFFVPGEFTLIFAGIAASGGGKGKSGVSIVLLLVIACVAAVLGDATGFAIGRRWGPKLKHSRLGSKLKEEHWNKAEDLVVRRKGLIVLVGRWVGFLRAIMPATAGMTGMNYKRDFLMFDVVGAVTWAGFCLLGGYKLGERAETVVKYIGWVAGGIAGAAFLFFFLRWRIRRARPANVARGDTPT
jgi:membrane-associated protein